MLMNQCQDLEVKTSLSAVKEKQILKYTDPSYPNYVNADDKKVIYFIKDAIPNVPREAQKLRSIRGSGAMMLDDLGILKEILKNG